jgi:uncharacterized protein (TIGR02391 family)
MARTRHPVFSQQFTEAVCNVLAQTDPPGLTGSELERLLPSVKLQAMVPGTSKRDSLMRTLHNAQADSGAGNALVAYLKAAMSPVRFVGDTARFKDLQGQLNQVLILEGLRINDEGLVARAKVATNLREAAELAGTLSAELRNRGCHKIVMAYCSEELLNESLFHAMTEASKSVPARLRRHTGLPLDGEDLFSEVFSERSGPAVKINAYVSKSDKSEHTGFKSLLTGIHSHYRNPRAHTTRLGSDESKADLYDAFALFSYIHRRLDAAGVAQ